MSPSSVGGECAGGRWQRLGYDAETCAAVLLNKSLAKRIPHEPHDIISASHHLDLIWLAYLEAIPPGHEYADPLAQARRGVARAIEYFHGDWRDGYREFPYSRPISRARSRTKLDWIHVYRTGLLMAVYADDDDAVGRLIAWPDLDLPIDDGLDNLTAGDNFAQIALAFQLRGEPAAKISRAVEKPGVTKRKRASAFWAAAEAIAGSDPRAFALRMKELCELHLKSAATRERFPRPHVAGSILWHVARRAGLTLPELPERHLDWILRSHEDG